MYNLERKQSMLNQKLQRIDSLDISYVEAGDTNQSEAVIMLHGFPTSSYLWRNIMPDVSIMHRVIAIDLPGYGESSKALDVSYSLNFYTQILERFFGELNINKVHLVVHDLGGPIGMHWAVRHKQSIKSLIFMNTIIYSKIGWGVILFTAAIKLPLLRDYVSSNSGIKFAMRLGTLNSLSDADLEKYTESFADKVSKKALIKSAGNISIKGLKEIEEGISSFDVPTLIIYGEDDRILPTIERTVKMIKADLPQAKVVSIPDCGHFLQEDCPEVIKEHLLDFYAEQNLSS